MKTFSTGNSRIKTIISSILVIVFVFSCCNLSSFAVNKNTDFCTVEKNSDNVEFNVAYPEIGKEMKVSVNGDKNGQYQYKWFINNEQISNFTDAYTPVEGDMEKMITVKVYNANAELIGVKSMFVSSLPVVYIEVDNRDVPTKKGIVFNAQMTIQGNKEFNDPNILYNGKTEIKVRGNSTSTAAKKPYKLKLDKKSDLFGMGKNKHWVLLSNPYDTSNLKNDVFYKLAADMGLSAMKTEFVDVVMNGKSVGIYQLCEHVRVGENRINITDWDTIAEDAADAVYKANKDAIKKDNKDAFIDMMTSDLEWVTSDKVTFKGVTYTVSDYYKDIPDITGGYLLNIDNSDQKQSPEMFHQIPNDVRSYTIEVPEYNEQTKSYPNKEMENYITNYFDSYVKAAFSKDFCIDYNGENMRCTDFIDIDSFAKGIVLNELIQNEDFGFRSTYIHKDIGSKLTFGPIWDMDYSYNKNCQSWVITRASWVKAICSDPVMMNAIRNVYWKYRYTLIQDLLEDDGRIETTFAKIKNVSIHNDEIWNTEYSNAEYKDEFKNRLQYKIQWMDETFATLESAIASLNNAANIKSSDVNLVFNSGILNINCTDNSNYAKIYVDGILANTINDTASSSVAVTASDNSVITVVTYDEDGNVLNGNFIKTNSNYVKTLSVKSGPDKMVYNYGEAIDLTGLVLTAKYTDGTSAEVTPDLVYTYTKDALGPQFYQTNKITDTVGKVYMVFCYENRKVEIPVNVNPTDDYSKVQKLINNIPSDLNDTYYMQKVCEAWVEYNALSTDAKALVENANELNEALDKINSIDQEIVDVYAVGVLRTDSVNRVIVLAKGEPSKIVFHHMDGEKDTTTFTLASKTVFSTTKIGNLTAWTINFNYNSSCKFYSLRTTSYNIRTRYDAADIFAPEKKISKITWSDIVYKNSDCIFNIENCSSDISAIKVVENDTVLANTEDFKDGVIVRFATPGMHNVTVCYMSDGKWFEYTDVNIHVRESLPNYGDVNGDGFINSLDALLILKHSVGVIELIGNQFNSADVTHDNIITSLDALYVLQYATGKVDKLA